MALFLKNFEVEIQTVAPVFIGSGEISGKKEYLYDRDKNEIIFLNMQKMFVGLTKLKKLGAYEEYLLQDRRDLFSFFRSNGIHAGIFAPWIEYKAPVGDEGLINRQSSDIFRFVKDPYGNPYIPGSSLKGMIRTALLADYYEKHQAEAGRVASAAKQETFRNRRSYMAAPDRDMSSEVLHSQINKGTKIGDMQNDIMRGLIISDSNPIAKDRLCICQKVDQGVDGTEKRLNLLRECLKPDTTVTFSMSIDPSIFNYSIQDLANAITAFYKNYHDRFAAHFAKEPFVSKYSRILFLGGGTGYASKTVANSIFGDEERALEVSRIISATLGRKQREEHRHDLDVEKGVSPHILKCTIYAGKKYQMGACWLKNIKVKKMTAEEAAQ